MDVLTYAGNLENLKDIEKKNNYRFIKGDICDEELLPKIFSEYKIDAVIHLAAESHQLGNPIDQSVPVESRFSHHSLNT